MKKRIMSLLLAVAMTATMVVTSVPVFAEEPAPTSGADIEITLTEGSDAAGTDGEVKLQKGETIITPTFSSPKFTVAKADLAPDTTYTILVNGIDAGTVTSAAAAPPAEVSLLTTVEPVKKDVQVVTVTFTDATAKVGEVDITTAKVVPKGKTVVFTEDITETKDSTKYKWTKNTVVQATTTATYSSVANSALTIACEAVAANDSADLSALSVIAGTDTELIADFDAATTTYTATTDALSVKVTATKGSKGTQTIKASMNGGALTTLTTAEASSALNLKVGENTLVINVTSEEPLLRTTGVTNTYTVKITRTAMTVATVAVKTPPTDLSYAVGDKIDLTDMEVTLTYADPTQTARVNVTEDVALADFAKFGIKVMLGDREVTHKVTTLVATDSGKAFIAKVGEIKSEASSATVTVKAPSATPVVKTLDSADYKQNYSPVTALDATATVTDSGTITYKWYSNTVNSTEGTPTDLSDSDATYTPVVTGLGTTYYFCQVTNTKTDCEPTVTYSNIAKIFVYKELAISGAADATSESVSDTSNTSVKVDKDSLDTFVNGTSTTGTKTLTIAAKNDVKDVVLPKEAFGSNRTADLVVEVTPAGGAAISWTIPATSAVTTDLNLVVTPEVAVSAEELPTNATGNIDDAEVIQFAHNGALPRGVVIKVATGLADGNAYLYEVKNDVIDLSTEVRATIDAGVATITGLTHCSNWVLNPTRITRTGGTSTPSAPSSGGSGVSGHAGFVSGTQYTIKASASAGGTISPTGSVKATNEQLFEFTPDKGFEIDHILVDGKNIGTGIRYKFRSLDKDHTIKVVFKKAGTAGTGSNITTEVPQTGVVSLVTLF